MAGTCLTQQTVINSHLKCKYLMNALAVFGA